MNSRLRFFLRQVAVAMRFLTIVRPSSWFRYVIRPFFETYFEYGFRLLKLNQACLGGIEAFILSYSRLTLSTTFFGLHCRKVDDKLKSI